MELLEIAKEVNTKEDFLVFLKALLHDFKNNISEWENKNMEDFFEALHSSIDDMEGFYSYKNIELPKNIPWFIFSNALMSARIYE